MRPKSEPAGLTTAERQLAQLAYRKVLDRQELTTAERNALKRLEKHKEEQLRWQYYTAIPQKHWRQMSGRQTKILQEQAVRYGLPFGSATIHLPTVVRALHDFLAEHGRKLLRDEEEALSGGTSPALERYREERAALARLDRLEREGELLPRETIRAILARIASLWRNLGESLEREFDPAVRLRLDETLDEIEAELARWLQESEFPPESEDPDAASAAG